MPITRKHKRTAYDVDELAERWAVSIITIRRMIARGEITAYKVGRKYRIPVSSVNAIETQVRNRCSTRPDGQMAS